MFIHRTRAEQIRHEQRTKFVGYGACVAAMELANGKDPEYVLAKLREAAGGDESLVLAAMMMCESIIKTATDQKG